MTQALAFSRPGRPPAASPPSRRRRRLGPLVPTAVGSALASVALWITPAHANDCQAAPGLSTCIQADTVWAQPGQGRWFRLGATQPPPHGAVGFGFVTGYLSRPIGLQVASADPEGTTVWAVDNVVSATYLLTLGVGGRTQIGLAMPTVLYQDGAGLMDLLGTDDFLPRSAAGDLRFGALTALLEPGSDGEGPAVAARFDLSLPTGAPAAFVSNGAAVYAPGVAYHHRLGRFHWGLDASGRIRPVNELAGARIGSQLGVAGGVGLDILADGWLSAGLEGSALVTLVEQHQWRFDEASMQRVSEPAEGEHVPAEWLLSVRSAGLLDGRLVTSLAGGSFIPTGDDSPVTVPRFRFMAAVRYVPHEDTDDEPAEHSEE